MTHTYAPILNAIMEGKTIQLLHGDGSYIDIDQYDAFYHLSDRSSETLRVKPDVINIAGVDVVKPTKHKPKVGCAYYFISPSSAEGVSSTNYINQIEHNRMLEAGMCWLTRDAAVNAAAAIKKLLMGG